MQQMQNKRRRFLRRGTIMIMVVALLVLLALMGTAWIASVSTDRGTSRSNTHNTQADLSIEALADMVKARVGLSDLMGVTASGNTIFRPRAGSATPYVPWTCPVADLVSSDPTATAAAAAQEYLASRTPVARTDSTAKGTPTLFRQGQDLIVSWPAISAPLMQTTPSIPNFRLFPSPFMPATHEFESPYNFNANSNASQVIRYNQRLQLQPTFINLTVNGIPKSYPAFQLSDGTLVLAADTDGDGVADAGLWPAPGGQSDGITWYYAVRIIDNNSAINVNTAWQWANNSGQGTTPDTLANLFPSNVDLASLAKDADLTAFNTYRFGGTTQNPNMLAEDGSVPLAPFLAGGYDALWHQLGRRLDNPGYNLPRQQGNSKYSAVSINEQLALDYRFIYENRDAYGELERRFPLTFEGPVDRTGQPLTFTPADTRIPVPADAKTAVTRWFDKNFNYIEGDWRLTGKQMPMNNPADGFRDFSRRAIMVARNPVSIQIDPAGGFASNLATNFSPASDNPFGIVAPSVFGVNNYPTIPAKVSLNTAPFQQLWLGYWNVMAENFPPPEMAQALNQPAWDTTPFWRNTGSYDVYYGMHFGTPADPDAPTAGEINPAGQFRSPIRDNNSPANVRMDRSQVLLLRAALAAANTMRLRSGLQDTPAPPLVPDPLQLYVTINGAPTLANVSIFPAQPQPFITEVYVNTDDTPHPPTNQNNPRGYIAIELYNPFNKRIDLTGWKIGCLERPAGATYKKLDPAQVWDIISSADDKPVTGIDAKQYLVIENYTKSGSGTAGDSAKYRPTRADSVKDLTTPPAAYVTALGQCLGKELVLLRPVGNNKYAPVDQFDLAGMDKLATANGNTATDWHYVRNSTADQFRCVYPGRYWGNHATSAKKGGTADPLPRHQGTRSSQWDVTKEEPELLPPLTLGTENPASTYPQSEFPIQIFDQAGPNTGKYPFGGFARVGDVLQVPFIGAYTIQLPGATDQYIEMNSLPMDAAFAEDTDTNDDLAENIGRFCPVLKTDRNRTTVSMGDDWDITKSATWRYRWAMKVFDYFTVFAPYDDYSPSAPRESALWRPNRVVANADPNTPNTPDERLLGVDGLININTAPSRVLAALPLAPEDPLTNANLAQAIALYRDGDGMTSLPHGPFKTLFDLYKVPAVLNYVSGKLNQDLGDSDGNISPSKVKGDFVNQYLFLTRISNMVTTRSDTFTCYISVQGWKNIGTNNPQLVSERRSAFILDRTGVTPDSVALRAKVDPGKAGVKTTLIPNE